MYILNPSEISYEIEVLLWTDGCEVDYGWIV